jgi:hypothetical protein
MITKSNIRFHCLLFINKKSFIKFHLTSSTSRLRDNYFFDIINDYELES